MKKLVRLSIDEMRKKFSVLDAKAQANIFGGYDPGGDTYDCFFVYLAHIQGSYGDSGYDIQSYVDHFLTMYGYDGSESGAFSIMP